MQVRELNKQRNTFSSLTLVGMQNAKGNNVQNRSAQNMGSHGRPMNATLKSREVL